MSRTMSDCGGVCRAPLVVQICQTHRLSQTETLWKGHTPLGANLSRLLSTVTATPAASLTHNCEFYRLRWSVNWLGVALDFPFVSVPTDLVVKIIGRPFKGSSDKCAAETLFKRFESARSLQFPTRRVSGCDYNTDWPESHWWSPQTF